MATLLHSDLTYRLRGLGFAIHSELGGSHAEGDYEQALLYLLEREGLPFRHQPQYRIQYRGKQIGEYYPDLTLADEQVLVELKATPAIERLHKAQVLSYLAVTGAELGLIMNFGGSSMQYERVPNFLAARRPPSAPPLPTENLLHPALTHTVLQALYQVHHTLGPGFLHQIYRRAVRIELGHQGLGALYLQELPLTFQGQVLARKPVRLFLVEQRIVLATVALRQITTAQIEKLRWALRENGVQLGLIANFYPAQLDLTFVRIPD